MLPSQIYFLEQFTVSSRLDEAYTVTRRRGEGKGCVPCVKAAETAAEPKNVGKSWRKPVSVTPRRIRVISLGLTPSTRRKQKRDS